MYNLFICRWTSRLLPRSGCCKYCCNEHMRLLGLWKNLILNPKFCKGTKLPPWPSSGTGILVKEANSANLINRVTSSTSFTLSSASSRSLKPSPPTWQHGLPALEPVLPSQRYFSQVQWKHPVMYSLWNIKYKILWTPPPFPDSVAMGESRGNKEVFPAALLKVLLTLCRSKVQKLKTCIMNVQSNFLSVEFSNNNKNDKKKQTNPRVGVLCIFGFLFHFAINFLL